MRGYLLNFYKYSPTEKASGEDDFCTNNFGSEKFVRSMIWSTFDRLEVRDIDKFGQYREAEYSEKNWVGERQFSMIYEADNKDIPKRLNYFKQNDDKCLFPFDSVKESKKNRLLFFGISMVDLTPEAYDYFYSQIKPGEIMRKEFLSALDEIVAKNNICDENICYDIYGTLGGNDLIIIWLANQFKDVVSIIEALRKSKINSNSKKGIIANISTIMGLRNISQDSDDFQDIEGNLNIRLTKKEGFDDEQFKSELSKYINIKKIAFETILGEHDLSFKIPSADLATGLYKENGFIHIRNRGFFDNFLQASTELSVAIDYKELKEYNFNIPINSKKKSISAQDRKAVLESVNRLVETPVFKNAPYLKESLWILYEDYLKNISSAFTYPWTQDLHFYFIAALTYLEKLIAANKEEISNKVKYDCIDLLISSIRQLILHIAQSNRLFFEVPNVHLKHTGTYSKVLRAYQGIIKQILKLAYAFPKFSDQSQIIPFVTFDITPIAKSDACPNIVVSEEKIYKDKIITIKLPYEALVDIPKYTFLLAHEIYHYIAPEDRKRRNALLGVVTITIIITQVSLMYIERYIKERLDDSSIKYNDDEWDKTFKIFKGQIEKKALEYTVTKFNDFKKLIENYQEDAEWVKYFTRITEDLGTNMHNCSELIKLIYTFLCNIDYSTILEVTKKHPDKKVKKIAQGIVDSLTTELENGIDEFEDWIKYYRPNDRITNEAEHIQYALREALADYFMLQATKVPDATYFNQILHYKDIISGRDDPRQIYRIGMIIDFAFPKLLGAKESKLPDRVETLKDSLIKSYSLTEADAEHIAISYGRYGEALKAYRDIFSICFESLDFSKISEEDYPRFNEILESSRKILVIEEKDEFVKNVSYIEHFQIQDDFSSLYKYRNKIANRHWNKDIFRGLEIEEWKDNNTVERFGRKARTIEAFLQYLQEEILKISDKESFSPIWFRGHEKSEYKLIPSLYRMKDGTDKFYSKNVRENFEALFKAFRVKSFGALEIYHEGNNSVVGTMASMQHYCVPTNILDWSTSAYVAMYFAVESKMVYCEDDKKKRKTAMKKCTEDADIWILNPIRLNLAYEYLKRSVNDQDTEIIDRPYPIPSIFGNEEEYQEFLPFVPSKHSVNKFPVAVYVPHVNQRIKAQVGTFTMFSLDVDGVEHSDKDGSYTFKEYDLVELQETYKRKAGEKYQQFLTRVTIANSCICEFADWLRRMGVDKPNIYPELTNVSKSLTNQIKAFLENSTD